MNTSYLLQNDSSKLTSFLQAKFLQTQAEAEAKAEPFEVGFLNSTFLHPLGGLALVVASPLDLHLNKEGNFFPLVGVASIVSFKVKGMLKFWLFDSGVLIWLDEVPQPKAEKDKSNLE